MHLSRLPTPQGHQILHNNCTAISEMASLVSMACELPCGCVTTFHLSRLMAALNNATCRATKAVSEHKRPAYPLRDPRNVTKKGGARC